MLTRRIKTPEYVSTAEKCVRNSYIANILKFIRINQRAGFAVCNSYKCKIILPANHSRTKNKFLMRNFLSKLFLASISIA